MQSLVNPIIVALIGAAGVLVGAWATQHWAALERSRERKELRRAEALARRDKDLRELGDQLTELVTAAKEVIWERMKLPPRPLSRSDPRSVRMHGLYLRLKMLQLVVGDAELSLLVSKASSAADKLSDSPVDMDTGVAPEMEKHRHATYQAFEAALSRIETLLRATENETAALGGPALRPARGRLAIWTKVYGTLARGIARARLRA